MTTNQYKRSMRINGLYKQALRGKYTLRGKFVYALLALDAKTIGVHDKTAEDYADAVIAQLKKAGHLK